MASLLKAFKLTLMNRSIIRTIFISYLAVNLTLISVIGILAVRDSTDILTDETIAYNNSICPLTGTTATSS